MKGMYTIDTSIISYREECAEEALAGTLVASATINSLRNFGF